MTSKIEIAPGVRVQPLQDSDRGRVLIAEMLPRGDGFFQSVAIVHPRYVPLTRCALRALRLDLALLTVQRLIGAGFIKSSQPAPGFRQMNLASLYEHQSAMAADPEFWTREGGRNARKFRLGISGEDQF